MTKPSRKPAARQAKYAGKHTMDIGVDLSAVDAIIAGIEGDIDDAVRPAAQAAAEVFYQAARANVKSRGGKTGNLYNAIYQAYSEDKSGPLKATYHISWNASKAPHGHLVEWGHIQRYASYLGKDGKWYTAVRPEMRGKPRPGRRASQEVKDAYYVTLASPRQVAAQPFIRPTVYKTGIAVAAAKAKFFEVMGVK